MVRLSTIYGERLAQLVREHPSFNEDPEAQELYNALMAPNDGSDEELIAHVVDVIMNPYIRNFSSNQINSLRRVLLRPDESALMRSRVNQAITCTCGRVFESGEAINFHYNSNGPYLRCARCAPPSFRVCQVDGCGGGCPLHQPLCERHTQEIGRPVDGRIVATIATLDGDGDDLGWLEDADDFGDDEPS